MKTGVVQGGVLSPALFNYYLADFPTLPPNIKLIKYADDITIYTSGPVVADLINGLNIYLSEVLNYINNTKLTVSTAKSIVTLFTPETHEDHLHPLVKLVDQVLPLKKKPNVLGILLDTQLTFTQYKNIHKYMKISQQKCSSAIMCRKHWPTLHGYETKKSRYRPTGQLTAQYSATAVPSGCHHSRTLIRAGSNRRKLGAENCHWLS